MPIEPKVLSEIQSLNIDIDLTEKCIEANRHNNETTTYYLLLRKFLKEGNISKADFSGKYFDKDAIEPNKRRSKHNSIKPEDIIKKSASPSNKKLKAKSFYQEKKDEDSFIERSVKIPKKPTRSKSKNKNNKSKTKDKSILRDHFNEVERHRNSNPKVLVIICRLLVDLPQSKRRRKI